MAHKDSLPVWKKLYRIVSVSNADVTPEIIDDVLEICQEKLVRVLLDFKPYTKNSFEEWKNLSKSVSISEDDEMCSFIHRLSKELDLDVNLSWSVICNFLIFDYYGKVDELKTIIRYEANVKSLIDHVWYFYSADRMFMLKTLQYIFEKLTDKDHLYFHHFNSFIETMDLKELWRNLLKTFEYLITEIDIDKNNRVDSDTVTRWVHRNNREQTEILLLMIHLINLLPLDGEELVDLLKLFMRHGFGRHPVFYGAGSISRPKDVVDIKNAEIGVILTLIYGYWQNSELCKMIPKQVEKELELYQIQGDNSAILFIWVVLKSTLSDEYLEYCNNAIEALLEKKVFKSLSDFLQNNIFQDCILSEIIIKATNQLVIEFIKICADYRLIYEQEGFVQIVCELLKRPYLHALDNLGPFFEIALDMFPYILDNFIYMCQALLLSEEHYEKVMRLLHNVPTYCTELPWLYASDAVRSIEARNLFLGTNKFMIPGGTTAERCNCYGEDVIKFKYQYDYFQVIEQYIRSLTMWAVNRGEYNELIFGYVLQANRFLTYLVKHYRGDFSKDKIIRPLIQRLDCVPTFYIKGGFRNFQFFYVYFEAKCALVMSQNIDFSEAFPIMIRKALFPSISNYKYAREELRMAHTNTDCILYSFFKQEESMEDHKLMLLYTQLILNLLKKNILHKEVLYGGVWFLVNVVFPTHQQWNYNDAFQQTKILNVCLLVFTKILQQNPSELSSEDTVELFDLVHQSFMHNDCIVNSLCSIFVKDKFYLQNLMSQESNWISGPTIVVIETVRLQLLLLLLMFKCRARVPKEKCSIDDRTHIVAKAACSYFINPYNCSLAVLACRFLEILARDENIPLMSCLGLDCDQVQRLFLDQLRDPMEGDEIKLNILDLINTCIYHQTGMTAAFFNLQSSKKWYSDNKKKQLDGGTVGDFMIDYLQNIKKSVAYLKSPLQLGILKVMSNLWHCEKQHLIKDITSLSAFWPLLADPLCRTFDQAPLVYSYIFKIFSMQFNLALRKPENQKSFFDTAEKFLTDQTQLGLLQHYLFKILSKTEVIVQHLEEREMLIKSWTELLVAAEKQDRVKIFPNDRCKYLFVELCLDGIKLNLVNTHMLTSWMEFSLVVISMFGLKFKQMFDDLAQKAIDLSRIIKIHYGLILINDRKTVLTVILKIIRDLKEHYEKSSNDLLELLEEIGPVADYEHDLLEEKVWDYLKIEDPQGREKLGPWAMIISIANFVLTLENCQEYALWFANRKYLTKMVKCTCDLLTYKQSLPIGKLALYSLTLYVQSPLAYDFLKVNMLSFYDRVEPMVNLLLSGQQNKINVLDLKDAWLIFCLIMKFNQVFIRRFQKSALETCYAFLTLTEHIIKHIMTLPEITVDFKALDLLIQTLVFYDEILKYWKIEWYRKSNKTFNAMIAGVKRVINSCIYICLRPKHIGFYFLDDYSRLAPLDPDSAANNDLMISVANRSIVALGIAFACLYKLNANLLELFEFFEPEESVMLLIQNDFSVPRFELPIPNELTYGKLLCLAHFLCKALSHLHQKGVETRTFTVDEDKYVAYVGLVEHQDPSDYLPNQKLCSFFRYTMYEYSGLVDPWIDNLDYQVVRKTSELIMMFIAQQAFLSIKMMDPNRVPHYKRNLCAELQFFNEHVKKRTSELLDSHSLASVNLTFSSKTDMDLVKRYLIYSWQNNKKDDISDRNFLLVISYWFNNICQVHQSVI